jgi:MYXO-CTERM domain-containing protein
VTDGGTQLSDATLDVVSSDVTLDVVSSDATLDAVSTDVTADALFTDASLVDVLSSDVRDVAVDAATARDVRFCRSNVCGSDGICGLPDGVACVTADQCRTAGCSGGVCGALPEGGVDAADAASSPGDAGIDQVADASSDVSQASDAGIDATADGQVDGSKADSSVASLDESIRGGGCSCSTAHHDSLDGSKLAGMALIGLLVGLRRRQRARAKANVDSQRAP